MSGIVPGSLREALDAYDGGLAWADGQRRLGQRCPGLGVSEREYQRAAAAAGEGPAGVRAGQRE